ncbi:MAG: polysaccharide biosynthesis protein [Oscillospiraceae bacterium]|nr:polysaccharide biosynthesis protein [Oscillospiraceae bacterium]
MSKHQLRSGVLLSYLNLALGMIIPFFYTPVMLGYLGQAEYGLYSLSSSAVSYLSLLSFGFGSTIIRYIAKYRAEGDRPGEERAFGFFLMLYMLMAAASVILGFVISANVEHIFSESLTAPEQKKMKVLVLLMACSTAIAFPISVFSAVIAAHERFICEKTLNILATAAGPLANLAALWMGYSSVGMVLAGLIMQTVFLFPKAIYCFRNIGVRPRFSGVPKGLVREMFVFSFFTFLATLVDLLFWATDKVILGMLVGTTAVAIYNMGGTFNSIVMGLSTSVSGLLVPRITAMAVTQTKKSEWTALFIRIGRLQFIIIGLVVSGFSVFGRTFLGLWVGADYLDAFWVAVLTLFPLCIPLIQNTGVCILTAQNKHRFRSVVYLLIAIVNIVTTWLAVPKWGYIGAAFCSCVAYLLGQGLIMNLYYHRVTGLDIPLFWKNIVKMSVVPAGMMAVGLWLIGRFPITDWLMFFVSVAAYTGIYALLMYRFSLNGYEKDMLRKPLVKLLRRRDAN